MRCMLKYDFYRMIKSVSTYLLLLCILGFTIASVGLSYATKTEMKLPETVLSFSSSGVGNELEKMTVCNWCEDAVSGDFLLMFIIIFAVILVSNDYSTGYIKNIYGNIHCKITYVISKILMVILFSICAMILTYGICLTTVSIAISPTEVGDVAGLCHYSVIKLLLLVTYGIVVIAISLIARRALVAFIIGIGYPFMLSDTVYSGINLFANKIAKVDGFFIQKYAVIGNIYTFSTMTLEESKFRIVILCSVLIAFATICSGVLFKYRDI